MEDASENNQFSTCYCQQVLAHFLSFQPLGSYCWSIFSFFFSFFEKDSDSMLKGLQRSMLCTLNFLSVFDFFLMQVEFLLAVA